MSDPGALSPLVFFNSDKQIQPTNKILVRNVPEASDEDHIQMFFEYEKKQGGGPVKGVTLNRDKQIAIVEFERESGK